jgi:hypothetical protein
MALRIGNTRSTGGDRAPKGGAAEADDPGVTVAESLGVAGSSGIGDTTEGSGTPSCWAEASASDWCGGGAIEVAEKLRPASSRRWTTVGSAAYGSHSAITP